MVVYIFASKKHEDIAWRLRHMNLKDGTDSCLQVVAFRFLCVERLDGEGAAGNNLSKLISNTVV